MLSVAYRSVLFCRFGAAKALFKAWGSYCGNVTNSFILVKWSNQPTYGVELLGKEPLIPTPLEKHRVEAVITHELSDKCRELLTR